MILYNLRIYTDTFSDPSQTSSTERSVEYFCVKLRLLCPAGFLNIYDLKYFYFLAVQFDLILFFVDMNQYTCYNAYLYTHTVFKSIVYVN